MKKYLAVLVICFLAQLSYAQKSMEYNIKRTYYTKGTYKTFLYELRNDSIIVIRYSTNDRPPKLLYSNALNPDQKNTLINTLNDFDLLNMKNEYIDKNVDGEGHSVYDISINNNFKSIYVYFVEVPDLKKLDKLIDDLLPVNQKGWNDVY